MNRRILPILGFSLILGFLFDLFFYGKAPGISVFLFTFIALLFSFLLAFRFHKKVNKSLIYVVPLSLIFSAMVFIRASGLLAFINIIFSLYILSLVVQLSAKPEHSLSTYQPVQYLSRILYLPLTFLREVLQYGRQLIDARTNLPKKQTVTPVVRGLILSIPFLLIFLLLFTSADLVFKKYVGSVFSFHVSPEIIFRLLIILFVTSLFVGAYALIFMRTLHGFDEASQKTSKLQLGSIESSIILGSVCLLFLVFVLIQITYFFGGRNNIINAGFTYAQYARKGFFELILVGVISGALLWALNKTTTRKNLRQIVLFMWLSGILVIEVFIIMLSAFRRLSLYEEAYGFTGLRLYSHLFIGWLAVVFILILVHIFRQQRDHQFAFQFFISVAAFIVLVNFLNPDALIARKNIQRYNQSGKIDLHYLNSLSEDSIPQSISLLHSQNETVRNSAARLLYDQKQKFASRGIKWQSFNLSRTQARHLLEDNNHQLEANKNYQTPPSENLE